MYDLPTSIFIEDKEYKIREAGDFRVVLDCFSALGDIKMGETARVLASLIIFYDWLADIDTSDLTDEEIDILTDEAIDSVDEETLVQLVKEMYKFFNCGQEDNSNVLSPKLIDWEHDSQMIMSAVNNVAGKEVRLEPYLHWWTFTGYYMSVGESVLATVVSIRNKILKGKKLEKWEKEFQMEHPNYFVWNSKSIEEQELDELMFELWDNGN